RIDPANAAIVQIAHRIAGVDWNGMVCTTAGTWGTAPTMGAFAGGADGPFGYLSPQSATLFGKASSLYGFLFHKTPSPIEPTGTEFTQVRTSRAGVDLSELLISTGSNITVSATAAFRNVIFDNGDVWAGEDGVYTWNLESTAALVYEFKVNFGPFSAYSKTKNNFVINYKPLSTIGNGNLYIGTRQYDGHASFKGTKFNEDIAGTATKGFMLASTQSSSPQLTFSDCWFVFNRPRLLAHSTAGNYFLVFYIGCKFTARAMTGLWSVLSLTGTSSGYASSQFGIIGGEFDSANAYQAVVSSGMTLSGAVSMTVVLDRVKNLLYSSAGLPASTFDLFEFSYTGVTDDYGFRYENNLIVLDFDPAIAQPYLLSTLPSGEYWSQRLMLKAGAYRNNHPRQVYKSTTKYRGSVPASVVGLKLLAAADTLLTDHMLSLMVTYQATDDYFYSEVAHAHSSDAVAMTPSDDVWTGQGSLVSYRIPTTTSHPIKPDAVVHCSLMFSGTVGTTLTLIIDPEPYFS
ncbi:MAG: hypothetical protein PHD04_04905, partial [Candidatus Pacebacteria bacterium]|nr:hypothetical protein [Candidatus Paceibacterota bacterium]